MIVVRRNIIILLTKYDCLIGLVISSRRQVVSVLLFTLTAEPPLVSGFIIDILWQEKAIIFTDKSIQHSVSQSISEDSDHDCSLIRGDPQWPDIATCIIKNILLCSKMPVFRKDPCGFFCIIMTYGAVLYADYVVVRWL